MNKSSILMILILSLTGLSYNQSIRIITPNGQKILFNGKTSDITWTGTGYVKSGVKINIFKNSISQANFVLQLTGNDTGRMSWRIPDNFPSGYYFLRIKTSDNNIIADSNKFKISEGSIPPPANPSRNRFKTSNVNVNLSAKSGPTPIRPTLSNAPDLVITSFRQDPPNPQKSEHWRFEVSIKNIGNADAFFPKGYNIMGHNVNGTFINIAHGEDLLIRPGMTIKKPQYASNAKIGTFPVTFKVDPDDIVKETNEMNNKRSGYYTLQKLGEADLVITKITTDIPRTTRGFYVYITMENKGLGFNPIQGQQLWIKTIKGNPAFSFSGFLKVDPGESQTVKCWVVNPPAGSISWEVKVDPDNILSEANENNNVKVLHLTVK